MLPGFQLADRSGRARVAIAAAGLLLLAACQKEPDAPVAVSRPVRIFTVQKQSPQSAQTFTGRIEAQDQPALSFRVSGRLAQRAVDVGSQVKAGQIVARLDPENELNALRSARAASSAAEGVLTQAENNLDRQRHLLERGVTSQAHFEAAAQGRKAAFSQVVAAKAQLQNAEDWVRFTELEADGPGIVTAVGAEPGEVVQAGQMVIQLARTAGRDAVFDVPSQLLGSSLSDVPVSVHLSDDPKLIATGRVREISPQADPITRTFQVRVGLADPPAAFRLGTTVIITMKADDGELLPIPTTALTADRQSPAVWVVDAKTRAVSLRKIELARVDPATAFVAKGLTAGDVVVTAGVNSLKEGQLVRLSGTDL
nr:efflux RND transporter periplasmic adaptor subunit [Microvirga antarctica]